MKKLFPSFMSLAAMLYASLLLSCASDIDMPPPPLPPDELSSSSSSSGTTPSSSSLVPSSSSVLAYNYCVFLEEKICLLGPMTSCPSSGVLSNSCPYGSSSSTQPPSNSSSSFNLSSSSSVGFFGLCAGFVDGTTREHYGKTKAQFCDPRDGKKYVYVTIGDQVWMAENLNYDVLGNDTDVCYNKDSSNCDKYGRLYDWTSAMGIDLRYNNQLWGGSDVKHRGICPTSWHLPSDTELEKLMTAVGGSSTAGTKLKATSGWNSGGNGQDTYGFAALPGGDVLLNGNFYYVGNGASWWTATERDASNAYNYYMGYNFVDVRIDSSDKLRRYSVRCVQD